MAIESITCPNCGNTGVQIDTTREHSFCIYCGSTLRAKDVLNQAQRLSFIRGGFLFGVLGGALICSIKSVINVVEYISIWNEGKISGNNFGDWSCSLLLQERMTPMIVIIALAVLFWAGFIILYKRLKAKK